MRFPDVARQGHAAWIQENEHVLGTDEVQSIVCTMVTSKHGMWITKKRKASRSRTLCLQRRVDEQESQNPGPTLPRRSVLEIDEVSRKHVML